MDPNSKENITWQGSSPKRKTPVDKMKDKALANTYGDVVGCIGDDDDVDQTPPEEGTKHDDGKTRWDLLPYDAVTEVAKVFTGGAGKYDDRNWEQGITYGRVFRAMIGHTVKWWLGKRINHEDFGLHHLAHAVACGLFLLHYDLNESQYNSFDDRPNKKEG